MKRVKLFAAALLHLFIVPALQAQSVKNINNLWVNGTFENVVVSSQCNIYNPVNAYSDTAPPFFGYTTFIWTAGNSLQPSFVNEASIDHTTGAAGGHYFYDDPRADTGASFQIRQSIKVKAGTTYTFSAWFCSMLNTAHSAYPAMVQLRVNGVPVSATMSLSATTANSWQQLSGTWTATTSGMVDAMITDLNPVVGGHDFAIDDILFGAGTLQANAGVDKNSCINTAFTLGGNTTGDFGAVCGNAYTYQWTPSAGFTTAANIANPTVVLTTPGAYTYTVTVTDLNGNTCSDTVVVTAIACEANGVNTVAGQPINVFPNPAGGSIHFENLPARAAHIMLYNAAGQKVLDRPASGSSATVDLLAFPAGFYYYMVTDDRLNILGRDKFVRE